jgi:hypothetical protein
MPAYRGSIAMASPSAITVRSGPSTRPDTRQPRGQAPNTTAAIWNPRCGFCQSMRDDPSISGRFAKRREILSKETVPQAIGARPFQDHDVSALYRGLARREDARHGGRARSGLAAARLSRRSVTAGTASLRKQGSPTGGGAPVRVSAREGAASPPPGLGQQPRHPPLTAWW